MSTIVMKSYFQANFMSFIIEEIGSYTTTTIATTATTATTITVATVTADYKMTLLRFTSIAIVQHTDED
jgi:hypothetical protein